MMLIVRQTLYDCGPFITEDGCSPETPRNSEILKSFDILRLLFHRIIFSILFTDEKFYLYYVSIYPYINCNLKQKKKNESDRFHPLSNDKS